VKLRRLVRRILAKADNMVEWLVWLGFRYAPKQIPLERVTVRVADLPAHLEGFTIGVLSDLHLGVFVTRDFLSRAAARLAAEQPNLAVVAGDFLAGREEYAHLLPEVLAPLGRPYGVLGNWDWEHPENRSDAVRLLVNTGVEAAPGLWLAGVDDVLWGEPSLKAALAGAPPGAVRVLLCHEPDFADEIRPSHRIALQISGHSHGGQIRLPFAGPLMLPTKGRKYHTGLYRAPATQVYTSRGLGVVHLPFRLWCPPEVTLITLVRG
jgi:predicted MPP superfamily phosphohydrolase